MGLSKVIPQQPQPVFQSTLLSTTHMVELKRQEIAIMVLKRRMAPILQEVDRIRAVIAAMEEDIKLTAL